MLFPPFRSQFTGEGLVENSGFAGFKAVGFKAAMANGSDRVKAITDVIAPDCDSDGVAAIIEQYFLD